MCGFAGEFVFNPEPPEGLSARAARMNATLRHRGPDMTGQWVDAGGRAALAFSRLAIQDLSEDANQPMSSESGRYVLVFNGEIYNVDELRQDLGRPANSFRTHSDTEVLLACIEKFGLPNALERANGMFAVAVFDRFKRRLALARDRLGKKPLHYAVSGRGVRFASELKAILAVDDGSRPMNPEAVAAYFALTYVPAPLTIFEGIRKVRAGGLVEILEDGAMRESRYWTASRALAHARELPRLSHHEALEEVDALLTVAVRQRLVGDVPMGVLLSGGVDSSLVANAIARRIGAPLRSYTIGLEDRDLDERAQAEAIARRIGIPNVALTLSQSDALRSVQDALRTLDEPFGDYSALPTFAVCRLARRDVTVLLSGDGGDESFGGYSRYLWTSGWRAPAARAFSVLRSAASPLANADVAVEIYRRTMTTGRAGGSASAADLRRWWSDLALPPGISVLDALRLIDLHAYLPDDILVKTDRMSMASSLELRSPLLDYRLVELSFRLHDSSLVRGEARKRVLRELFERDVGADLLQRRKYGFGMPIGAWLAGPLRAEMEEALRYTRTDPDIARVTRHYPRDLERAAHDPTVAHRMWVLYAFWRWANAWLGGTAKRESA